MESRSNVIVVEQTLPSERLDTFLRTQLPEVSRGTIQRLLTEGHIRVNGRQVKPTHHPRKGDRIEISWPEAKPAEAQAQELPVSVIFEDEDLLVINKQPGIVVHPAAGHEESTLVNAILHHCEGQLSGIGGVARPGIVHRLDKDTSGCMVVAKNDATHVALTEQFANREVEKVYQALVCGVLTTSEGEITASIARHPTHRKRMAVTDGSGREAWTSYRVLERLYCASFVEARLHTGRTHQIRVHFHHLGFPLAGDETYGIRQNTRLAETLGGKVPRQMLHARHLSFMHPSTETVMDFEAPLPEDFKTVLQALRTLTKEKQK